jgi:hypothetical protein
MSGPNTDSVTRDCILAFYHMCRIQSSNLLKSSVIFEDDAFEQFPTHLLSRILLTNMKQPIKTTILCFLIRFAFYIEEHDLKFWMRQRKQHEKSSFNAGEHQMKCNCSGKLCPILLYLAHFQRPYLSNLLRSVFALFNCRKIFRLFKKILVILLMKVRFIRTYP